jgi:hypothetical protein
MAEYAVGDTIRLTIEGTVQDVGRGQHEAIQVNERWRTIDSFDSVEVIRPAPGPQTDAEGTWRRDDVDGTLFRKNSSGNWVSSATGERYASRRMGETTVVAVGSSPVLVEATVSNAVGLLLPNSPEPDRALTLVDCDTDRWRFNQHTLQWHLLSTDQSSPTFSPPAYAWGDLVTHAHWFPMRAFTR